MGCELCARKEKRINFDVKLTVSHEDLEKIEQEVPVKFQSNGFYIWVNKINREFGTNVQL